MTLRRPEVVSVKPAVDGDVLGAIELAVVEVWPKPEPRTGDQAPAWRFSGRWWSQPAALRRDRPVSTI